MKTTERETTAIAALWLIARSDTFNGGTWVEELQRIAREALAKLEASK